MQSVQSDATVLKIGNRQSSDNNNHSKQVAGKAGSKARAKAFEKATAKVKKALK